MSSAVAEGANSLYRRFSSGMGMGRSHSQTETTAATPNGSKSSGTAERDKEGFVRKRRRLISLSRKKTSDTDVDNVNISALKVESDTEQEGGRRENKQLRRNSTSSIKTHEDNEVLSDGEEGRGGQLKAPIAEHQQYPIPAVNMDGSVVPHVHYQQQVPVAAAKPEPPREKKPKDTGPAAASQPGDPPVPDTTRSLKGMSILLSYMVKASEAQYGNLIDKIAFAEEIEDFLKRLFKVCRWTEECHVLSFFYMLRLLQNDQPRYKFVLRRDNSKLVMLGCLWIAQKFWDDRSLRNSDMLVAWERATKHTGEKRIKMAQVNKLEVSICQALNWQFFVSEDAYDGCYKEILAIAVDVDVTKSPAPGQNPKLLSDAVDNRNPHDLPREHDDDKDNEPSTPLTGLEHQKTKDGWASSGGGGGGGEDVDYYPVDEMVPAE